MIHRSKILFAGTRNIRRRDAGFTLLELLVVLAILGLLAAIATPQVLKYLGNAKISTAKLQVQSLSSSLDLYRLDNGAYPTTEQGLVALTSRPADAPNWAGPYVKQRDSLIDPWGHPYVYRRPGEHGEFDLSSTGPNGGGGSGGDTQAITSW
jgi:general secretion pathway protein G